MSALVAVEDAAKHFRANRSMQQLLMGEKPVVKAVDGVTFALDKGESVGIVGESGCGKTTLGRMLLKLISPTYGAIRFDGVDLATLSGKDLLDFRRRAQLVFQNPFDALNPRFTIREAVTEPLKNTYVPADEHEERILQAMQRVRLGDVEAYFGKYRTSVADEPVSMLDVTVRAGILNVMRDIDDEMGIAAIYISHDLALVRYVCQRAITMYLGIVAEDGPTEEVVGRPHHPYTQALEKAVPTPHVDQSRDALPVKGGMPNPQNPPSGCRFRDRCPHAFERCAEEVPRLREVSPAHYSACHLDDRRAA